MRFLVVATLLVGALAGCTDAPVEDEPLVVDYVGGEDEKEPEYLFKVFGQPDVDQGNRTVDMRIFHGGDLVDISTYEAEPEGEREQLRSYLFREGEVTVQVYSEGEPQATMQWDPSECGGGPSDAIIRVDDARYGGWQGGVQIEYGCTPPG